MKQALFGHTKLWTLKVLRFYLLALVLLVIPVTSVFVSPLVLAFGPYAWGLMPHVIVLALLADIANKRLSPAILLIPISFYATYYLYYFHQNQIALALEAQLKKENPVRIFDFNSVKHSLIINNHSVNPFRDIPPQTLSINYKFFLISNHARRVVNMIKVPVTYTRASNDAHISFRLLSKGLCGTSSPLVNKYNASTQPADGDCFDINCNPSKMLKQCILTMPSAPERDTITVNVNSELINLQGVLFYIQDYSYELQERKLGTVKIATQLKLPIFPFLSLGCRTGFVPSTKDPMYCYAGFVRSLHPLDTNRSDSSFYEFFTNPIGSMLGIKAYSKRDFDSFEDYPENVAFVKKMLRKH